MTLMMDSPRLRELTRTQLQALAKREVVRAVGKTEDIIRRLMRKHPRGVPVPEHADNPSASTTPPRRSLLKRARKATSPVPETPEACTNPTGKDEPVTEAAPPLRSSSTAALGLLCPEDEPVDGPSNLHPESVSAPHPEVIELEALLDHPSESVPPPEQSSHESRNENEITRNSLPPPEISDPGWQVNEEEPDEFDYPKGAPSHYMVVDALRQFTTLVNAIPSMKTRIAESRCLLQRTETLLKKATPDARELTVTREYLETFLLAKMKQKRELWDGTGRMKKEARKFRMEWLRAERRAENEKRWKEANELNKRHGLKPEPFSAFASESDEEIIESLQTTPTSSKSGSSKRSREECMNAGSNGDGGTDVDDDDDDESQRKRARA